MLGLIKWEQIVFLGNPEYGVDMAPFDFVKFAEAAGAHGVHIEDPKQAHRQMADALAMDVLDESLFDASPGHVIPDAVGRLGKSVADKLVRGARQSDR